MSQVSCTHCHESLTDSHTGKCPKCGESGKTVTVGTVSEIDTVHPISWRSVKEYYEKDTKAHVAVIIIIVVSPFIGLFIADLLGVSIGVFLGIISYFLSPKALVKVREIRQGP